LTGAPASAPSLSAAGPAQAAIIPVLLALSFSHFLNDTIQSLIPAIYPILKTQFALTFGEVGLIALTFQITASLLQPLVGIVTDKRPMPYSLAIGMGVSLLGLLVLSRAPAYAALLIAAGMVGMGSAVFHPEASRTARAASGGRLGFAQSFFQVGGNCGSAMGPLLAAFIVLPYGQHSIAWFALVALLAMVVLAGVGRWSAANQRQRAARIAPSRALPVSGGRVAFCLAVLVMLIFSKYFYLSSLNVYYTFYLIHHFGVSVDSAQLHLFIFLAAVAAGTFLGGPIGDRIGRKYVIWGSILGVFPFTFALPFANLFWTTVLTVPIGMILASAFAAILVYATELVPGRVGMISGLFFGIAFGMGGIGAAVLGVLADSWGIDAVYRLCAFLPLMGLLAAFLPDLDRVRRTA
jgi:FSR family fosmidomycin resistance protein-like MFS transporter